MDELDQRLYELAREFQMKRGPGNVFKLMKQSLVKSGAPKFKSSCALARFLGVPKSTLHDWQSLNHSSFIPIVRETAEG